MNVKIEKDIIKAPDLKCVGNTFYKQVFYYIIKRSLILKNGI